MPVDPVRTALDWAASRRGVEPPQNAYDAGYDEAMSDVQVYLRTALAAAPRPAGLDVDAFASQVREDIEEAERDLGHALDIEGIENIVAENARQFGRS